MLSLDHGASATGRAGDSNWYQHRREAHMLHWIKNKFIPQAEGIYSSFVEAVVGALDASDHEIRLHSERAACHTLILAQQFFTDPEKLRQVYWGALLHDIGKIALPDTIPLKEGSLTGTEWTEMRTYPEKGYRIVSKVPCMEMAAGMVLMQAEHYDGTGYPPGLAAEHIPFEARLFSVTDALDAMTSNHPYRNGRSFDQANMEIQQKSGSQFDPGAVHAFTHAEERLREMIALKHALQFNSALET